MEKKQWIVFLQLFASISNLILILVSISIILSFKDGCDSTCVSLKSLEKKLPHTHLHGASVRHSPPNLYTVSKRSSVSETLLTSPHSEDSFQPYMKYVDYVHKELGFRSHGRMKKLKIAVPMKSRFKQFVEVSQDGKHISGFSIDVFRAAVGLLPYKFSYELVPFNGSTDDLLNRVASKTFDAAIGDIIIKAKGYKLVEFSQPYVEAGLSMVVKTGIHKSQPWLCFTLFTPGMWFALAAMSLFTGFVIWFIEHQNGTPARPIGTVLWVSFATLYSGQRESPNNSLSHFVLAPWLFLMLVVSATFTSSLTSIMTNSNFVASSATNVNELKRTNAIVASDGSSYINQYLVKVLGFKQKNIRSMDSINEYAKALSNGDIKAVFMLTPYAKVFLAKYCNRFAITGPTYKLGGFGFVFQKGSRLAIDMSEAILRLNESEEVQLMEEEMLSSFICSASLSVDKVSHSFGAANFLGLFIISGCASAIALLITWIRLQRNRLGILIQSSLMGSRLWSWLVVYFSIIKRRIELQPEKTSSTKPSFKL